MSELPYLEVTMTSHGAALKAPMGWDFLERLPEGARLVVQFAEDRTPQPVTPADNEREMTQLIEERDRREEVIDQILDIVLGSDRHEWSSAYDFADAVIDVEDRMASLAKPVTPAASLGEYAACCDTPSFCSSVRRCTAQDGKPHIKVLLDWRKGDNVSTEEFHAAVDCAIVALTQPVTPAGGEVEPVAWAIPLEVECLQEFGGMIHVTGGCEPESDRTLALYLHPSAADAALDRVKSLRDEWRKSTGVEIFCENAADELDAALNQRGGGDHG